MANRQVSEERKAVYYIGTVLMVIGFITFFSTFFVFGRMALGLMSNHSIEVGAGAFESGFISFITRPIIGIILIIVGGGLRTLGMRGLAGSGVILDPEKAREDLEPWTRMAGGMVGDAVDESGINLGQALHQNNGEGMPFDEKLRRLHKLHEDGIITDNEYEREKQRILDQG